MPTVKQWKDDLSEDTLQELTSKLYALDLLLKWDMFREAYRAEGVGTLRAIRTIVDYTLTDKIQGR